MKLFGSIKELVSAVFRKDTYEITVKPNSNTYTGATEFQLPPKVSGNGVLVASGDIVNADIAAGAAIVDTKLATIATAGKVSNSATTAASANTASAIVARDGSGDFSAGTITATLSGNATNITAASNSTLTTLSSLSLPGSQVSGNISGNAANVSGTVALGNGGTGQTTQQAALTALAGTQASGQYLRSNGTNTLLATIQAADVPTLNQNTTGTAANVTASSNSTLTTLSSLSLPGSQVSGNISGNAANVTGTVAIGNGGTGQTTANAAINALLPSQAIYANKYLKTDGTNTSWASAQGGSGEINAVANSTGADGTTDWTAGTSHSISTVSGSLAPLNPAVATAFSMQSSAAVTLGSQTATSGVYDTITMPSGLQNRKLKVEFFFTTPASSTGTWAVAVYQGSTKVALSTDSSGDTILPAGVTGGKFVAYFDTTSAAPYSVNFVQRTRTSNNTLYVTNVIVGPGIQPQGAVVGEWTSYTPTSALTNATHTGRYRRVGSNIELRIDIAFSGAPVGSFAFSQSSYLNGLNLTVDGTAFPNTTDTIISAGSWSALDSGANDRYGGAVNLAPGATNSLAPVSSAGVPVSATAPFTFGTGDNYSLYLTLPIAEWAGSGTVQLAQNDVEYAFNSSTSTSAGDATSFGYGPTGARIQNVTVPLTRRVRFQTPIQPGDRLTLEISTDTSGTTWMPLEFGGLTDNSSWRISPFQRQNTASYGIGNLIRISSTDVDIYFAGAASEASGVGFGAAGEPWSNGGGSRYWRIRKSSAGAAVGFGLYQPGVSAGLVSSSGLAGRADGNVVPAGYVGEELVSTVTTTTATANSATWSAQNYTLAAGVWLVSASVKVTDGGTAGISAVIMNTATAGALEVGAGQIAQSPAAGNSFLTNCQSRTIVSNGSTSVNAYVFVAGTFQNGTDSVTSVIRAVRIA